MARLYKVSAGVYERSKGQRSFDVLVSASHVGIAIRQAFARFKVTAGASCQVSARVATASEQRAHEAAIEARQAEVRERIERRREALNAEGGA